jgi:hypothetical protein
MAATAGYTPLESLLLFQGLATQGSTEKAVFHEISESLRTNPLVCDAETFDAERLEVERLREFCVDVLHKDDEVPQGSRKKRKLTPLLTGDYSEKLNGLAAGMWIEYKDDMLRSIREDEDVILTLLQKRRDNGESMDFDLDEDGDLEMQDAQESAIGTGGFTSSGRPTSTFQFPVPSRSGFSTPDPAATKSRRPPPLDIRTGSHSAQAISPLDSPIRPGSAEISPISEPSSPPEDASSLGRPLFHNNRPGGSTAGSWAGRISHTPNSHSFASHGDDFLKQETQDDTALRTPDDEVNRHRLSRKGRLSLTSFPGEDESTGTMVKNGIPYVLSSRNFGRTAASVWSDISQHKHASIFAAPVREKDAPGYADLIKRPQDLKSIKTALSAGSKAVAAAVTAGGTLSRSGQSILDPSASPGQGATPGTKNVSLWIPLTPESQPPKAIVNSIQMERELLRMFANAVMFNPNPDGGLDRFIREKLAMQHQENGDEDVDEEAKELEEEEKGRVVNDTREMYADVMEKIADWKAAEHAAEGLRWKSPPPAGNGKGKKSKEEEEERAGTEEVDTPGTIVGKRGRRK